LNLQQKEKMESNGVATSRERRSGNRRYGRHPHPHLVGAPFGGGAIRRGARSRVSVVEREGSQVNVAAAKGAWRQRREG